ncbi:MAG TPA: ABC transporter substrate-binding protein, partial [Candidatus Sulfotelmatobacter sp.]|nr:ABC transporter substrate-binding protein [Candidatus Sulfotelmatobacter sp.]
MKTAAAGAALLTGAPFVNRRAYAADPLYIGVVSPASGNYADHGMMERLGMTMAAEEKKEVLGRPIKLIVEDDETDPQVGARKARRLIEVEKVKYLIGGVSSSVAVSVGEVCQRNGAIFIGSNQNSDTLTEQYGRRVQFMVPPDMAMALRTLAPYLIEKVGKRWYFLTHDYEWGWSGTKWARNILQKFGGTDLGESKIPLNTRDMSAFLLKVRAAKPDALVITVGGIDLAALMEQMYEFGIYKETTVVMTLINLEDLWAVGPDKMQGICLMEWVHTIDAPGVKEFVASYKKRWPSAFIPVPTANTLNGYISVRELLRAIERAGKDDVTAVIKAMEGHTSPDSLKHDPLLIRDWDHKFVWASYVVRTKKGSDMKDRADFVDVLRWSPGKDTARTKEENPV